MNHAPDARDEEDVDYLSVFPSQNFSARETKEKKEVGRGGRGGLSRVAECLRTKVAG